MCNLWADSQNAEQVAHGGRFPWSFTELKYSIC